MRMARFTALVGATAAATLALSACTGGSAEQSSPVSEGGTAPLLTLGSLQEPTSWDPAQANEGHLAPIYQSMYDTLLKREPNGDLSPMLATEWTESEDGLSLDLELRDDVTFTDGTPFDAEAVKANVEHFQQANGPMLGNLSAVESVEVVDEDSVTLHLSRPNPDLPFNLSNAGAYMGSPAALEADIASSPVGSGPYVLDQSRSVVGSTITLTRNPDYWGEELPYDEVQFKILVDETARLNALTSGQINVASLNRAASAIQLEAAGMTTPEQFAVNWGGILFFDRDGVLLPELADVRVREALAIAIDTETLVSVGWEGLGEPTSQVFGTNTEAFDEALEDAYDYDPDRARELLADAGASDLTFTLPVTTVFEPAIYDAIVQNWEDIGVTVERHQWGPGEPIPSMLSGEYPISFFTLAQRSDWGTTQFLISPTAPWNPLKTTDPELEALIADYPGADEEGRAEIARQINEFVIDNVWFAPILRPNQFLFWDDSVSVEPQVQQAVPSIYNYTPSGT